MRTSLGVERQRVERHAPRCPRARSRSARRPVDGPVLDRHDRVVDRGVRDLLDCRAAPTRAGPPRCGSRRDRGSATRIRRPRACLPSPLRPPAAPPATARTRGCPRAPASRTARAWSRWRIEEITTPDPALVEQRHACSTAGPTARSWRRSERARCGRSSRPSRRSAAATRPSRPAATSSTQSRSWTNASWSEAACAARSVSSSPRTVRCAARIRRSFTAEHDHPQQRDRRDARGCERDDALCGVQVVHGRQGTQRGSAREDDRELGLVVVRDLTRPEPA